MSVKYREVGFVQRAVARETLRQARVAAFRGDHVLACRLFAALDIPYVVEINNTRPVNS